MARGKFVVVDGIDGVGKGVFLDTFVDEAKKEGRRVFDVHEFWREHDFHPPVSELINQFDVIVTSEPTFVGIGRYIREELIAKNERHYSPEAIAEAYALDRRILYQQLLLPVLDAGIDVYQSRSFSTSLVYQRQSALDEGRDFSIREILSIPGNVFCYSHPMDYLVIPTIVNVEEALHRSQQREKDDNCMFENLAFQLKIKAHYESNVFRMVFMEVGTEVVYLDAGRTLEFSKQQAKDFFQQKLRP